MKTLLTGGGFLGRYIIGGLLTRGDCVRMLARRPYPDVESLGVEVVHGDLCDAAAVARACAGIDVVFHVAARAGYWGSHDAFFRPNVTGTRNVLDGCRAAGVTKLVFSSTASVVFASGNENADESTPYAESYKCPYPESKAIAERMVLGANGRDNLSTVALRPHFIYGPGDPHFMPRILERARKGQLVQVGDGRNKVDISYVENVAEAHLQAADRLGRSAIDGKAYFISQGTPVMLWPWLNTLLERAGLPGVRRQISHRTAVAIGSVMEIAYRAMALHSEPRMTRFLADLLATSHYYDTSRARRDFGYQPRIGTEEGLEKTLQSLRHTAA